MASRLRVAVLLWADTVAEYAFSVMQDYLTEVWGISFTDAAAIINIWEGISSLLQVFLLFIGVTCLGNFMILVCSSIAYCVGIGLVTLSIPPVLAISFAYTCQGYVPQCVGPVHKVFFNMGMALIAVGKAGYRVLVGPFIKEQKNKPEDNDTTKGGKEDALGINMVQVLKDEFDNNKMGDKDTNEEHEDGPDNDMIEEHKDGLDNVMIEEHKDGLDSAMIEEQKDIKDDDTTLEQKVKMDNDSKSEPWCRLRRKLWQLSKAAMHKIPSVVAMVLAFLNAGVWSLLYGITTICHVVATVLFLSGWRWPGYQQVPLQGSPLTTICRVLVASAFKLCKPVNARELYNKDGEECQSYSDTRFLGFLKKAAIILPDIPLQEQARDRWRLCSLAEVEEAKVAIRTVPMWMTFILWGIVLSMGNTYFIEQAVNMDPSFLEYKIPTQVLILLCNIAKMGFRASASKLLRKSKNYAAAPSLGIATAMMISVLCCITSAKVETQRLDVIRRNKLWDVPSDYIIPVSMFWLTFQFVLLGALDSVFEQSIAAFYRHQTPNSMNKYTEHYAQAAAGVGQICSVFSVYVVGRISEIGGRPNWFQLTLNRSHLDRYYWVLAVLSIINLVVFIPVASCYTYQKPAMTDESDNLIDSEPL